MAALKATSSVVDFYTTAINLLLTEMGEETDEVRIDVLHGKVLRLTSRMADEAFVEIVNRTRNLTDLADSLRMLSKGMKSAKFSNFVKNINDIASLAESVVAAAKPVN